MKAFFAYTELSPTRFKDFWRSWVGGASALLPKTDAVVLRSSRSRWRALTWSASVVFSSRTNLGWRRAARMRPFCCQAPRLL